MRTGCFFIFFLFLFSSVDLSAQDVSTYQIEFSDKGPLTIKDIQLSEKSLKRRQIQGIQLNQRDIPVFKPYIQSIADFNTNILFTSRWSNSVFIKSSEEQVNQIKNLPFVKNTKRSKQVQSGMAQVPELDFTPYAKSVNMDISDYFFADPQITQIEGKILHENGYKGHGITIAVFDAGFYKTNEHPVFKKAFNENRITAGPDFVRGNGELVDYTFSAHGEMVLSTMAGDVNGTYIGTAPEANYILIRTENAPTEAVIEEYYWLQAAEYADSLGVDMINSSLGYTVFNDSLENHTYEQMDGDYTLITQAADWAAQTGILVVNSAGNSGASPWYYIGAPADGDSVFSIGAVDRDGISASFSSHGPTYDGRVKPNVVGHGAGIFVASGLEDYGPSNGTSFSGPVICGMTASLWQYLKTVNPGISNMEVIALIEESAHLYPNYDEDYGYGIPNYKSIVPNIEPYNLPENLVGVYPNPFSTNLTLHQNFYPNDRIEIYSVSGQLVAQQIVPNNCISSTINTSHLPQGAYVIAVLGKHKNNIYKAIK